MKNKLFLISCAKGKNNNRMKAKYLYDSDLFRKSVSYASLSNAVYYILSAKHGLLHPDKLIDTYDKSLNQMSKPERITWSRKILRQYTKLAGNYDEIVFLAGVNYREHLMPLLADTGAKVHVPMEGLSIGNQLKWLKGKLDLERQKENKEKFYQLINQLRERLGQKLELGSLDGAKSLPQKGVYFFFEKKERRSKDKLQLRVTRVGTHAVSSGSKSTLWQRLRTHRGSADGGGNHRGSIFRLHVGDAILKKKKLISRYPTWSIGQTADRATRVSEREVEGYVSAYLAKTLILWVDVWDESSSSSDRAFIERNAIALLSASSIRDDKPSTGWLGNWSEKEEIRTHGLWNINHIEASYDFEFIDIFQIYVEYTIGDIDQYEAMMKLHNTNKRKYKKPDKQRSLL